MDLGKAVFERSYLAVSLQVCRLEKSINDKLGALPSNTIQTCYWYFSVPGFMNWSNI